VGDEDDREPIGHQLLQHGEEVLGLLRGQDGCRLVQDEDARLAVEGFQDLDSLLDAYREVGDPRPRVNDQAVALGELLGCFYRPFEIQGEALARLGAKHDVLGHGEGWDQGEVLVDHPDAAGYSILRVVDFDLFAVDEDGARVRLVESVEDLHQGGLPCAVLAQ
jgi:hypothetical protein